jgi:predicted dehydrogenase
VVDPDPAARRAAQTSGLRAWPSLGDALADPLADGLAGAAVVASPPADHVDAARVCVRAGLPALVEKPLALSWREAAAVAADAHQAGVPVLVAQNFRFLPRERAVRAAVRDGRVGAVTAVSVDSGRSPAAVAAHVRALPHGFLWDFCLHHLDALRARFGAPPEEVGDVELGDGIVAARLRWPGFDVAYRHSDRRAGYHYRERVDGTAGTVLVDDRRVRVVSGGRERGLKASAAAAPEDVLLAELVAAATATAAAGLGPGPSALGAADNIATIATVEAVIEAAAHGRPVPVAARLTASPG